MGRQGSRHLIDFRLSKKNYFFSLNKIFYLLMLSGTFYLEFFSRKVQCRTTFLEMMLDSVLVHLVVYAADVAARLSTCSTN